MTDPIADMLTRIRNAIAAKHSRVDIPASKLKLEIARILKEEGYINNFVIKGEGLKRTDSHLPALRRARHFFDHASGSACRVPAAAFTSARSEIPQRAGRLRRQHRFDFARA